MPMDDEQLTDEDLNTIKEGIEDTWRLRVDDYRMIMAIKEDKIVILALEVAHRIKIYR